jgi:hypothetical protein
LKVLKKAWPCRFLFTITFSAVALAPQTADAAVVSWDVDPTTSYIRLTVPDQALSVTNLGNVTLRMRDAANNSQWTDAGGRRAALDGEIVTDYADGLAVTFLGGAHNLRALETTSLRPNPADWDPATTNYVGTSTAPAALGGRLRGTFLLTFDAAFLAFRSLRLDLTNAAAGPIAITNGLIPANSTRCGIATALLDVDGLALPLGLGQPIPDVWHVPLDPMIEGNGGGGSVANLGGLNRKLSLTINIPQFALGLGDLVVTGSVAGWIVAYAVIPAPPPPALRANREGETIALRWPTNATGFSLECATNLPATTWTPASPPPVIVADQNVITNTTTGAAVFYRLRKP